MPRDRCQQKRELTHNRRVKDLRRAFAVWYIGLLSPMKLVGVFSLARGALLHFARGQAIRSCIIHQQQPRELRPAFSPNQ
jgi:hypothetical protein